MGRLTKDEARRVAAPRKPQPQQRVLDSEMQDHMPTPLAHLRSAGVEEQRLLWGSDDLNPLVFAVRLGVHTLEIADEVGDHECGEWSVFPGGLADEGHEDGTEAEDHDGGWSSDLGNGINQGVGRGLGTGVDFVLGHVGGSPGLTLIDTDTNFSAKINGTKRGS